MFKRFTKTLRGRYSHSNHITISRNSIYISASILRDMPRYNYVDLYFDEDNSTIGVKLVENADDSTYRLNNVSSSGRTFGCTHLVCHYSIKPGSYGASIDDGMIVAKVEIEGEIE